MEVQSECAAEPPPPAADTTPPCDPPQPPPAAGKINRAAFKLFGKRRSGSGMAGFFSFRNKGSAATAAAAACNNNNANNDGTNGSSANNNGCSSSSSSSVEIIRSKTHDGLAVEADGAARGQEVGTVRSLSKSLSFFSLLRRGSLRASGGGGGGESVGRRGRGLKGLFSSMRWRRNNKDKSVGETAAAVAVLEGGREARCDEEVNNKDITLTLEPPPPPRQALEEDHGSTAGNEAEGRSLAGRPETTDVAAPPPPVTADELPPCEELDSSSVFPYTPTDSPLHSGSGAPPPPLLLLSSSQTNNKTSVSSYSPPPSATPPLDPPSEPSVERLCSLLFTDVTSLKSFDSLTGCGDITADADEEAGGGGGAVGGNGSGTSSSSSGGGGGGGAGERPTTGAASSRGSSPCKTAAAQLSSAAASSLPARARVAVAPAAAPTPLPQQHHLQAGSGVVAYMGGGEEMASPEGVDDADMQGLWHMLPSTGDNSPALPPRSHQTPASASSSTSNLHHHHRATAAAPAPRGGSERNNNNKPPQVKALGLSKIPVVGGGGGGGRAATAKPPLPHGGRHAAACTSPPADKEPLSDEGYWDTPSATPTATPDEGGGGVQPPRSKKATLMSRDSCSGDHLYDLYNDPEEGDDDEALGGGQEADEDDLACSTPSPSTEYKLSPPSVTTPPSSASSNSSFRSMKGSASLPRDSKIPISVSGKPCTPPHSVSQSALSSVVEASSTDGPPPKTATTEASALPARTRIPVSKVPVRRSAGNASRGHRK